MAASHISRESLIPDKKAQEGATFLGERLDKTTTQLHPLIFVPTKIKPQSSGVYTLVQAFFSFVSSTFKAFGQFGTTRVLIPSACLPALYCCVSASLKTHRLPFTRVLAAVQTLVAQPGAKCNCVMQRYPRYMLCRTHAWGGEVNAPLHRTEVNVTYTPKSYHSAEDGKPGKPSQILSPKPATILLATPCKSRVVLVVRTAIANDTITNLSSTIVPVHHLPCPVRKESQDQ